MQMDVRYKFFLLIAISIAAFAAKDLFYGSLVFSLVCLLSFLLGQYRESLKFVILYLLLLLFLLFSGRLPAFLRGMLLMIVLCMRMCLPILLYGRVFLKTTKVSEMVTGLYAMRIPRAFVISFAVAMRFFPTAKEEIRNIREAMSLRGIECSLSNLFRRPAVVFEGFLTPLLIRASTIAEELSAASITRGLDNPAPRTSFTKLRIGWKDTGATLIFISALLLILLLRSKTGG